MSLRRTVVIEKASNFLELSSNDVKVLNIEKGIFNTTVKYCKENDIPLKWSDSDFVKYYSKTARKVLANISYTSNSEELKSKIKTGLIDPYILATMSHQEMAPDMWSELKMNALKKHITKKEETPDGIFTCNNCKSKKTVYYQMQTRSADEPMTTYVTCTNCNKKWKC
jgi:transcription elongation factor S-II